MNSVWISSQAPTVPTAPFRAPAPGGRHDRPGEAHRAARLLQAPDEVVILHDRKLTEASEAPENVRADEDRRVAVVDARPTEHCVEPCQGAARDDPAPRTEPRSSRPRPRARAARPRGSRRRSTADACRHGETGVPGRAPAALRRSGLLLVLVPGARLGRTSGREGWPRAAATVPSREPPSATTTSTSPGSNASRSRVAVSVCSSSSAGTMTLTAGPERVCMW